jgi:hypothetical protein
MSEGATPDPDASEGTVRWDLAEVLARISDDSTAATVVAGPDGQPMAIESDAPPEKDEPDADLDDQPDS